MSNYVPGIGPNNARLAIVGEAPGADEDFQGIPFVGKTGQMVNEMLASAGLPREFVYLTNVSKYRPPENDIKKLKFIGKSIEEQIPQLWDELTILKPNAVLALGETALKVLTGFTGIKKYRGSILQSTRGIPKIIPTIHPAALLHGESEGTASWKDQVFIQWDFDRAVKQSTFPGYETPRRNLHVCRSSLDLFRFLDKYKNSKLVSVDIETFRTFPICIGLAFNKTEGMSIPLFNILSPENATGMSRIETIHCWIALAELLHNPRIFKIGQNFKFDGSLLSLCYNRTVNFGLTVNGFFFDTMLAFKTLYPELPGSLQFQTSVLTEEPYYKEEGKGYNPKKDKIDRLLLYNARDAVVTYECYEREMEELNVLGLSDFFFSRIMPLHPFYSRIEGRGIKRDNEAKKKLEEKYSGRQKELEGELLELTEGLYVNVNSNGPKGQVASLLFGVLKIPKRASTDEKTLDALVRNAVKDPRKKRIIKLILELRKLRKVQGTYLGAKTNSDGKLRTNYRIMLETGRTSTSNLKSPLTTEPMGLAFQTITKHGDVGSDLRSMLIPDEGYIFIEPDLSQAEDRVVSILARDEKSELIYKYGIDKHRITAAWIFGRAPDDLLDQFYRAPSLELAAEINRVLAEKIADWERQIGKMFRHAGNLGMQKRTAAENAGVSEWRASEILKKFHSTNPNIEGVFHKEIQECLANNDRVIINPFGRRRQFFNKWGDELFKEAYAHINQSTVSDHLKFAAQRIESRAPWIEILQESHDSFLAQIPIRTEDKTIPIIVEELETPIDFSLCSLPRGLLTIPCEIKIGTKNWEHMKKVELGRVLA